MERDKPRDPITIERNEDTDAIDVRIDLEWLREGRDEIITNSKPVWAAIVREIQEKKYPTIPVSNVALEELTNEWGAAYDACLDRSISELLGPLLEIAIIEAMELAAADAWRAFQAQQLECLPTIERVDEVLGAFHADRRSLFEPAKPGGNRKTPYDWRHPKNIEMWASLVEEHRSFWKWVRSFEDPELARKHPEFPSKIKLARITPDVVLDDLMESATKGSWTPQALACESARRAMDLDQLMVGTMLRKLRAVTRTQPTTYKKRLSKNL